MKTYRTRKERSSTALRKVLSSESCVLSSISGAGPEQTKSDGGKNPEARRDRDLRLIFRPYQWKAFCDRTTGMQVWLWSRQVGKSFTLAAWAVDRLITRPGRTVTMLSNSKFNGMELNRRCAEVCRLMGQAFEQVDLITPNRFETMQGETRITIDGQMGRILVLPANPRTARSFSGDLILDEFAFHEDGAAIWAAAEPIISGNRDFLCRIASTPNGKHNQFYRLATDAKIPLIRVTRTEAHAQGCPIFHPVTREEIDPATARALASNKRMYDQNYECAFDDENMALLTHGLISEAEREGTGVICQQDWSAAAMEAMKAPRHAANRTRKTAKEWMEEADDRQAMTRHILMSVCKGSADRYERLMRSNDEVELNEIYDFESVRRANDTGRFLYAGMDVGRENDRSVLTVLEKLGSSYRVIAILRMDQMRLPEQQERLEQILSLHDLRALKMDITGLGVGLFEYTQEKFGQKVQGVKFGSNAPVTQRMELEGSRNLTAPVKEVLATQLLQAFEDRAMQLPIDDVLRDDLRKPERIVLPSGRVSIAATRNESGHADHFWSLALALSAAQTPAPVKLEWTALRLHERARHAWERRPCKGL